MPLACGGGDLSGVRRSTRRRAYEETRRSHGGAPRLPVVGWVHSGKSDPQLAHDPARILAPFVRTGMTVFEPGPGMGFFTFELARLVGPTGRVSAVDVQPKMIEAL